MSYNLITIETTNKITKITLNNPKQRNALSYQMINELTAALTDIGVSNVWGVILQAKGSTFCSGHDFADMLDQELAHMRTLMKSCSTMMQLLHTIPQPVVASVQGAAIGAGCQLALMCDMVVASETATFRTAGGAGGWFCLTPMVAVTRAIGRKQAIEMLMCGDPIPAATALEWGMINRVVPVEQLHDETRNLIQRATQGSRLLKGIGKQAFYTQIEQAEVHAYHYATELMASTGVMPHPQERMRAFSEKREPLFDDEE